MGTLKDWLRLLRAQTWPATLILVATPFLLKGNFFSFYFFGLGVFTLLAHYLSFGHNSLMDTAMGYDLEDPSKEHHPLVKGRIELAEAHNLIHTGLFFTFLLGLGLAWLGENPFLALSSLLVWISAGHWYNDGCSKTSKFSFVPISICFTALSFYGFFLSSSSLTPLMLLIGVYFFLRIWFQIDWSGNLKDLETGENNMLKELGVKIIRHEDWLRDWFDPPFKAFMYGIGLTIAETVVGLVIFFKYSPSFYTLPFLAGLLGLGWYYVWKLCVPRPWDREESLDHMSKAEICFIYLLPVILAPKIGIVQTILLLSTGVIYFFLVNKVLWKALHPKV